MAATQKSVVVTKPDANTVLIAIGNETHTVQVAELQAMWNGRRDLACLIWQMFVVLQQAGVNPNNATAAQMKTAIEAQTYWWGN